MRPATWARQVRALEATVGGRVQAPTLSSQGGWSTARGRGAVGAVVAASILAVIAVARRPGLGLPEIALAVALAALVAGGLWLATRPLWRPPARWASALLAAAVVLPVAAALWAPELTPAGSVLGCFLFGLALAAPAGVALFAVRRRITIRAAGAGALLAGVGAMALHLHCAGAGVHALLGHATVPLACLLLAALSWRHGST